MALQRFLHFPELLDILAVAAGEPPSDAKFSSSTPTVSVLPDRLLNHDQREVMREARWERALNHGACQLSPTMRIARSRPRLPSVEANEQVVQSVAT